MSHRNYVTLEHAICPVCGVEHDHGCGVLLDMYLRDTFEHTTISGHKLCAECESNIAAGLIALVEGSDPGVKFVNNEDVVRTGRIFWVKAQLFQRLFKAPVPEQHMAFVEVAVGDMLQMLIDYAG